MKNQSQGLQFLSTLSLRRATVLQGLQGLFVSFLSTLSLRRATMNPAIIAKPLSYFYPRSPCGERRCEIVSIERCSLFLSTLSLRRATDTISQPGCALPFLSTLSLRRATHPHKSNQFAGQYFYPRSPCGERQLDPLANKAPFEISIHALLAESDGFLFF